MHYLKRLIQLSLLVSLFALMPAWADDAADDNTASDDTQVYHLYEGVDLMSILKIQYDKPRIVMKSVFPQLQGDFESTGINEFNQLVTDLIQDELAAFKNKIAENHDVQESIAKTSIKNDLYLDYDTSVIKSGKDHLVSIRFSIQGIITGLRQPYHYHRVINYDLDEDENLELSDLFEPNSNYLNLLSNYTRDVLTHRLPNQQMVTDGTAPNADNFKNWNIKTDGLLITFDENQVASSIHGAQTVLVPYSVLKPIVSSESPIASCVKYKSRCARNHLVTGGFIDEASNVKASFAKNKAA